MTEHPRCPDCGALAWDWHAVTHRHRPPCRFDGIEPSAWAQVGRGSTPCLAGAGHGLGLCPNPSPSSQIERKGSP